MARKREALQLRVPGRTVGEVVDLLRADRLRGGVRLTCRDDGRVGITQPGRSNPPAFRGRLRQDGADTVLDGEVRETLGGRFVGVLFVVLTVFMAAMAALLAVVAGTGAVAGVAVCGVSAVLFLGIALIGRKVRGSAFAAQAQLYRSLLVDRLGIDAPAVPEVLDDEEQQRLAALCLALYDRLHQGLSLRDCAIEVGALVDLMAQDGISRSEAGESVEALAVEFARTPPDEQAAILAQLRAQQPS